MHHPITAHQIHLHPASCILLAYASRPLAWTVLCLGLGLAVYATVRQEYQPYKQGLLPSPRIRAQAGD